MGEIANNSVLTDGPDILQIDIRNMMSHGVSRAEASSGAFNIKNSSKDKTNITARTPRNLPPISGFKT